MVANHNEEKRNQIWRAVMAVTTVLIIIIAAFFVIKLFTANPLEGKWIHGDSGLVLTIKGSGIVAVKWPEELEVKGRPMEMKYRMDKDTKTFIVHAGGKALQKAAKASGRKELSEKVKSAVSQLEGTYNYSIDKRQLTLTDGEYGDQMIFDKK